MLNLSCKLDTIEHKDSDIEYKLNAFLECYIYNLKYVLMHYSNIDFLKTNVKYN